MTVLSIVIPAYNEAETIGSTVHRTDSAARALARTGLITDFEILVVNDASSDDTEHRARVLSSVRVIRHAANRGYGAALKTGFLAARGSLIAFLDADGTYPPEALGALTGPVAEGRADIAVGVRDRGPTSGMPFARRVGNMLFAGLLTWIAESRVRDSASGMRVFRASLLPRLFPLSDQLDFIAGFSTRSLHEGARVVEIPISYEKRGGRSKLSVSRDGFRFLRTFVTVAATYNPLKFFGAVGLLFGAAAVYLGIGPITYYVAHHRVPNWEIYRLLTILVLVMVGLLFVNFGVIGNRLLALVTGLPLERRSFFGRLLLTPRSPRRAWMLGVALCAGAIALNHEAIAQYLRLRSIQVHWSYIFTGATMFLLGAQLLMTASLLWLFRKIEERLAYRRRLEERLRSKDGQAAAGDLTLILGEAGPPAAGEESAELRHADSN